MSSTDLHTTNLVDVSWLWSASADYHQCCWWHRVLVCQCTIVDTDYCGGWTQRFQIP